MVKFEIARVIIFAKDVPMTAEFYHRIFGLPYVGAPQDRDFIELDAGGCSIAIHRGTPATSPGRKTKVSFRAKNVSNVRDKIKKQGVNVGKLQEGPGFTFFDGRDPEGNQFQVSSRP
jgi:predicted enzyme related to lactoylglutathione lyase